jgi:ribosomal protein L29
MSVEQMIEEIQDFSKEELDELLAALRKTRLTRLSHKAAERWVGQKFDLRVSPDFPEPPNPFQELVQSLKV